MGKRQIVEAVLPADRKRRRAELGTLKSLLIRPSTVVRYEKAFSAFVNYLQGQGETLAPTIQGVDHQASDYLNWLWEEGSSLALAGDTLSALQHFQPSCRKQLQGSWRLLKVWQLHELPARAPPFSLQILEVVLGRMMQISPDAALGLYIGFRFLLRTGELLLLENRDILVADSTVILFLGLTKTAPRNPHSGTANLVDLHLANLLRRWKATHALHDSFFCWSPQRFRAIFQQVLEDCGLQSFRFKPYSLRRGGATNVWLASRNYAAVCHLGRWSNERTMRIYIQDSLALMNDLRFRITPRLTYFVSLWRQFSCVEHTQKGRKRGRGRKT